MKDANRREHSCVIGLVGPNAAGKGEVAECLKKRGFSYHSLSDIVRDEATARGLTHGREDLIATGNALRAERGAGVLAERTLSKLTGRDVVDSIRNPVEVEALRQAAGFVLLGVTAPAGVRFDRARARGRLGDGTTLDEFRGREAEENTEDPARQRLDATLSLADCRIDNSGSLGDLARKVDDLIERLGC